MTWLYIHIHFSPIIFYNVLSQVIGYSPLCGPVGPFTYVRPPSSQASLASPDMVFRCGFPRLLPSKLHIQSLPFSLVTVKAVLIYFGKNKPPMPSPLASSDSFFTFSLTWSPWFSRCSMNMFYAVCKPLKIVCWSFLRCIFAWINLNLI